MLCFCNRLVRMLFILIVVFFVDPLQAIYCLKYAPLQGVVSESSIYVFIFIWF